MDRGAPSQSITGTLMVLFAPSPFSFYRVTEYDDVERAKEWCERFVAITFQPTYVRLIVCNAIKWQDIAADNNSFEIRCNKEHRYMVLYQALEGLYRMFEFEQLDDAFHHALASRTRLQEMRASQQTGLPESVQVFAFILAGEWNPQNQPGEDSPFGRRALQWHAARGPNSATFAVLPPDSIWTKV